MTRQIVSLNDATWQFGQVARRSFNAPDLYDLPAVAEWLPATVPGNVRTDLLALGRIPDPFWAENHKDSLWVETVDWWYRRELPLGPLDPHRRAFLVFDGIDYLSAIFVNGRELARHQGMFSRRVVEITPLLRSRPGTELAVRLWGSQALPRRQLTWLQRAWQRLAGPLYGSWVGIYPDRSATLKAQFSFGWDFAPPIRTMGLWDDVRLVVTGPVFLVEAGAAGQPLATDLESETTATDFRPVPVTASMARGGGQPPASGPHLTHAPADLAVHLTLDTDRPRSVEVDVRASPANFQGRSFGPFRFRLDLPAGRSDHSLQCYLPQAALWQPWDRGRPHLYHLRISLADPDGELLDEIRLRTGIRSIDLQNWQFSLNGRPEFIRGLNWAPADSFPGRLDQADYSRLLHLARRSGANLLRVWGGGLREKRPFYELCDELGLLVWQEFPFACMFLGSYPRHPAYLELVEAECRAIVRQIRSHPAVITWCGGNEFSRRRNRPLLKTLAAVVREEDGSRPFIPVSPSFEQGGDAHNWHVWHGSAPLRAYCAETARFLSEFGLQALPHPDTLRAALPDPPTGLETHHADLPKLIRYAALFKDQPPTHPPAEADDPLIHQSQLAQATALQIAIEHMRRRKGEAGGLCLWQFNEPWPAVSWAIVDYFGRPKLAYRRLSSWYNPILVSLKFPLGRRWQAGEIFEAEIWAINDRLTAFTGCELRVSLDDIPIHTQTFDLPADSLRQVGRFDHRFTAAPRQISLSLCHKTETLAQNSYDLAWRDLSGRSLSLRLRRWLADRALR